MAAAASVCSPISCNATPQSMLDVTFKTVGAHYLENADEDKRAPVLVLHVAVYACFHVVQQKAAQRPVAARQR